MTLIIMVTWPYRVLYKQVLHHDIYSLIPSPHGLGMTLHDIKHLSLYCVTVLFLQSRQQHILDITLDPLGQWLACACLDGAVCLIPVISLMLVNTHLLHLASLNYCFYSKGIKLRPD